MKPELAAAIVAAIDGAAGGHFVVREERAVAGGYIAENLCLNDGTRRYFVKVQSADADRLAAEVDGLTALGRCDAIRVPAVVGHGLAAGAGFLVLEWLELEPVADARRLAEAVAALHAMAEERYGWHRDNFIGATPQPNRWHDDWAEFFIACRLRPQFARAAMGPHGFAEAAVERLEARIRAQLAGYQPPAALLHGDLWAGNVGWAEGRPALYDPAVYAGDAETDLAMAALFGGFPHAFFEHYRRLRPPSPGADWRRRLYQLYHVLNHVNLFGGGYVSQAQALIDELLA